MFNNLRSNTENYLQLTDEEFGHFSSYFTPKIYEKKEFLLKQGEVCDFEAYILSGAVIGFHEIQKSNKVVVYLMKEDWWVTDIGGWVKKKPSLLSFQTF